MYHYSLKAILKQLAFIGGIGTSTYYEIGNERKKQKEEEEEEMAREKEYLRRSIFKLEKD